jgi:hypothetical protein
MSEISILSAQFGALSHTVDQVNYAIIAFKKQIDLEERSLQGRIDMKEGELENARVVMEEFLNRLSLLEHPDNHSAQLLPNAAVAQLMKTIISETKDFFQQIILIRIDIEKHHLLNSGQLELLDQIVEILDQERSELFKKLRAARG